jgi:hypothetical protein
MTLSTLLGVTLASFSIAVPITVAGIGPFEWSVLVAGEAVGMNPVTAATLGFLAHGIAVFAYAIFGTIGLITLGVSLGDVLAQKPSAAPESTGGS